MFKYRETLNQGWDSYEAIIELPNDGTPDTKVNLVLIVQTHETEPTEISLRVDAWLGKEILKSRVLGMAECRNVEGLSCLLYGAARLETVRRFRPV